MIISDTNIIKVGMADLRATRSPGVIKTSGLGSCIGLSLHDPLKKIAGLAHLMLPSSEIAREQKFNVAKYADTAIPALIQSMCELGANVHHMQAKMAGGAQMFAAVSETMRIGPRNAEMCRELLAAYSIPLVAEDTGGQYGRSVEIDSESGIMKIRSVQNGVKEL